MPGLLGQQLADARVLRKVCRRHVRQFRGVLFEFARHWLRQLGTQRAEHVGWRKQVALIDASGHEFWRDPGGDLSCEMGEFTFRLVTLSIALAGVSHSGGPVVLTGLE